MNYKRAIKRVIPLDVLQSDELKDVLARYAAPQDEFGNDEDEGEGGDGTNDSDSDADSASSVPSAAFSATDPQRPPLSLSPARLVNMNEGNLRPAISAHCHKNKKTVTEAAPASRPSCHGKGGSKGSDDGSAAALALAAASAAAAAGGGGSAWAACGAQSWVPEALLPYMTVKWVAIGVFVLALLYAAVRYYRLWRALGWQYALSCAFPFARPLLCGISGLDSEQVAAEIEAFQGGFHPIQTPPAPAPAPAPPTPAPTVPAAEEPKEPPKPAAATEEPKATEPKKKSVTFSRDRVIELMVGRVLGPKAEAEPPKAELPK